MSYAGKSKSVKWLIGITLILVVLFTVFLGIVTVIAVKCI